MTAEDAHVARCFSELVDHCDNILQLWCLDLWRVEWTRILCAEGVFVNHFASVYVEFISRAVVSRCGGDILEAMT